METLIDNPDSEIILNYSNCGQACSG
jgi:hypothetical protein